jgi:hypothetical protein
MGAGLLPVAKLPDGQYVFLMGLEEDDGLWSDFGGGSQGKETPLNTALREGYEELSGFFGSVADLRHLVKTRLIQKVVVDTYTTFLFEVPYLAELPFYFANNHAFIKKQLPAIVGKNGLYEKKAVRWFTAAELMKEQKKFRPFYRLVIQQILSLPANE